MNIQTISLIIVALLGIPAGFILKHFTEEEMKAGRKWFRMISIASLAILIGLTVTRENNPLYFTAFAFMFFLSAVPLLRGKK